MAAYVIGTHTPPTLEPCCGEVDTSLTAMFRLLSKGKGTATLMVMVSSSSSGVCGKPPSLSLDR
jgi:hypothetical protein